MLPRTGLPVEQPVVIQWNRRHVPLIEAKTDPDLAVALGIVHAHLCLGRLELMRHIAQGRVSELIGASGVAADQLLRTLDVGRPFPAALAAMPPATRAWLEAFARRLNHHLTYVRPLPPEFGLFVGILVWISGQHRSLRYHDHLRMLVAVDDTVVRATPN